MITAANKPLMRIFFSILSFFYIAAIFILAGFPVAHTLSKFNPYSLLHIPLYGILAFLLILSIGPITYGFKEAKETSIQPTSGSARPRSKGKGNLRARFFIAGGIALVVGISDEIHQLYVPGRNGSTTDAVLDMAGIAIALLLCFRLFKTRTQQTQ